MPSKGKFIVVEGIDGSGKSTQTEKLHKKICTCNHDCFLTCEPSKGPVGQLIRKVLSGEQKIDQIAIANLFAADRTDHLMNIENGIRHLIDQGKVVVCDRYYFSSYAYHSQYMEMDWVISINQHNSKILRPDLTLFIDVSPEICVERIQTTRQIFDIYENIETLTKVRDNYFRAFERCHNQENIVIIDGEAPKDLVFQAIWQHADSIL